MSLVVRAVRGATTVDRDDAEHLTERVQEMVAAVFERNELHADDVISIVFTATSDICSKFPAAAARAWGLDDVPLLGAQELDVEGSQPRCIRMLAHVYTERSRTDVRHVFLHDARGLRVDITD